jgi:hypothetical protein
MTPLTPDGLFPACDIVEMPYFPRTEFSPRKIGVVMCYSTYGLTRNTLGKLDRNGRYICICREGDDPFIDDIVDDFPCVKYWFAINCESSRENVEAMPFGQSIGSTQRTMSSIEEINKLLATEKTIDNDIFVCFSDNDADRASAKKILREKSFATVSNNLPMGKFFSNIYHHNFMVSPRGNGIDCCRTWETIYLKSYPIVRRHAVYNHFADMPIAFVDDWNEISPEWIAGQKRALANRSPERAYLEYWLKRIAEAKKKYL